MRWYGMMEEDKPKEGPGKETRSSYQTHTYAGPYQQYPYNKLYRSTRDKWIAGVCGGIAEHFNKDPVLIRLLWIVLTLLSVGIGVIAYLVLWIFVDKYPSYYTLPPQHLPHPPHSPDGKKRTVHYHYYYKSPP